VNAGTAATPLLTGRGLTKRFGAHTALRQVDFDLAPGEVKGLLGANGAGKSTLLKILAGALAPDEGELCLGGVPLKMHSMRDAVQQGIALVSQELSLFPALSVAENLRIVAAGANTEESVATLRELGLDVPLSLPLERLSLGDRQLVESARALMQKPRVLILDEPTSALHRPEKDRLLDIIRRVSARGVGVFYVSHFLEEVLDVVDTLMVLRDGQTVATHFAPSKDRLGDLVEAMIGTRPKAGGKATLTADAATAVPSHGVRHLAITGLRGANQLNIPGWHVEPGKIVGVAGLAGSGVDELFAILFGRSRALAGRIALPSGAPAPNSIWAAVRSGVAYVPADRKRLGLMLDRSIADNVTAVRSLVQRQAGFVINPESAAQWAAASCAALRVKCRSVRQSVGELSGGNQQKVVFAKWLAVKPSLILLDDPTRGVDIGAKHEMHGIIRELADSGCVVLLRSSDALELVELSDRVHVFVDGTVRGELRGDALNEHGLMSAMNQRVTPPVRISA
jgi:ribose transport system ATP-binding protein